QSVGVAAAILTTRIFRSLGAGTAVRRLRRAGWRELADLASRPSGLAVARWTSRMLDRVGLLATRLGDVDQADRDVGMAALRDLRVGVNVTQLA
ncbi:FUSC family protein, partial [Streptococcus suis]